ncbi:hypothetical protein [Mesorhizobium sp. M2C.T.Ca.TU.002.02.1.1]|uniref:hypothetical protein n=1 Tax=Mesorhizobium sp. M2C.T.Ca.TU.002.02.1.1 TaxID=2496788 RepID=UPI000FCC43B7|nr:hypothetical protein [Mesorhizobium sp. M2C.T.Ca.TU.002.02.1.1]RUU61046.1 hypothetical protein EOD07_02215 [Mesorhizobium sp. M2C.T.Ca.TU.002.02.1.1]RUU71951.1 hypothetical protein EOD04_00665 [Mesorhizobium sp. M2C.T.Ca.TU.009.01.2.1]
MNEARPLVAYSFAYVRRQFHSLDELNANGALRRQRAAQLVFEKVSGGWILQTIADWSTYRALFTSREKFRHALEVARSSGAGLLLADIRELLACTKRDRISECASALDALDVEVWDASLRRTWQSMTEGERRSLVINATQTNNSRSEAVKVGIRLSPTEKAPLPTGNYKHGNSANRLAADQRARRLRDFVVEEMARLPTGEKLSPSVLAAALNAAGIRSARGGHWSHNTAKDLIARIGTLLANPMSP